MNRVKRRKNGADLVHGTADAAERNENVEIIGSDGLNLLTYAMVRHQPASDFSAVSSDFSVFNDSSLPQK
jgi:hypothetical protein